jgi:hypothetical protein
MIIYTWVSYVTLNKNKHMKKMIFGLSLLTFSIGLRAQQEIKRELLLTIPENETMVTGESRFVVGCTSKQNCIITRDNEKSKFYTYQNGTKIGAFNSIYDAFNKNSINESNNSNSLVMSDDVLRSTDFVTVNDSGLFLLNHLGKVYGPYKLLMNAVISEDKQVFHAIVRTEDNRQAMVSNAYAPIFLEGNIMTLSASSSGKTALVCVMSGIDVMGEMIKLKELNLSDEEYQARLMKLMEESAKQTAASLMTVYTSNGHKFGGYVKEKIGSANPSFCKTGGEHWMMIFENKLYVDGSVVTDFKDGLIGLNDVWISADGVKYIYRTDEKLVFSDGRTYDYPLMLDYCKESNEITWVVLENKNTFVKYSYKL